MPIRAGEIPLFSCPLTGINEPLIDPEGLYIWLHTSGSSDDWYAGRVDRGAIQPKFNVAPRHELRSVKTWTKP